MRRRYHAPIVEPEEDGLVCIRGHLVPPEWAAANARHHLAGFDDLPRGMRDKINYAETPEAGARPTCELLAPLTDALSMARAAARAQALRDIADD